MLQKSYYLPAILFLVLAFASCSMDNNNDSNNPSSNSVSILDNSFSPQALTVSVGRVVVWTNNGSTSHTVTSGSPNSQPGEVFDSGILTPRDGFSYTFNAPGQYQYFCRVHGASMTGVINVR